jgi:hypothetical protein
VQNQALLENDTNRQAYIDNVPHAAGQRIKGTPGLYSWEIFNEPEAWAEGLGDAQGRRRRRSRSPSNWLAAAIHSADPTARVTNGSQTFDYCSAVSGKSNWYSDSALRAAGGKQNGTLDFYEVHYYDANESQASGTALSPFGHPATYWGLDKKLVIGEFFAVTTDGVGTNDLYTNLYNSGYNGAWAWQYNDGGNTPSARRSSGRRCRPRSRTSTTRTRRSRQLQVARRLGSDQQGPPDRDRRRGAGLGDRHRGRGTGCQRGRIRRGETAGVRAAPRTRRTPGAGARPRRAPRPTGGRRTERGADRRAPSRASRRWSRA